MVAAFSPHGRPAEAEDVARHYHVESSAGQVTVLRDGAPWRTGCNLQQAIEQLETDVDLLIATESPRHIFVHAGVVAWREQAIVIPGISHSGKTTLVAALLRAGASYYSDEFAVFDAHGNVWPYPRPLLVRHGSSRLRLGPEAFGAGVGRPATRVGLMVATWFGAEAEWAPAPLTEGQAAFVLLANTPCARSRSGEALRVFERALRGTQCLAGQRGDADQTASRLLRTLEQTHESNAVVRR